MPDEAGRYTAEHTVMDKDLEIRELKHLLEVKGKKIKELEEEIEKWQTFKRDFPSHEWPEGPKPNDDVDYTVADESEDNFTEQLSFTYNQE